jgi:phosphate:Na+ symporter
MQLFDGWKFLAGLGLFLFGMFMMEEAIRRLSGRSFKTLIRRYTGTRASGLVTGLVGTAILQSSSAVSLMVLAFVGAGLMSMVNAIAVIMGAMVGTTLTAWIVAVFGFKFKIEAFALPLIGISGLGLVFLSTSPRYVNISKLLAAFGFLFLGLDYMKTSVEALAATMDLGLLSDLGLWVFVLAGILLTAIMQSSSATIAIILTTLFSGIIAFDQGAAMVIGANVGTTVTILLGAVGGIPAKKQAAAGSLLFKVGTAVVAFSALPLIFWLIQDFLGLAGNTVMGIALFHTLFNVLGVVIFFPLIPALARWLERFFPEKRTVLAQFITNTTPQVPEAALAALRREVLNQLNLSMQYVAGRYKLRPNPCDGGVSHSRARVTPYPHLRYEDLSRLHAEIFSFYAQVQTAGIDQAETAQMESIIRSSRSIMNATRNLYDLLKEVEEIGGEDNPFMIEAYSDLKSRLQEMCARAAGMAQRHEDETLMEGLLRFFESVEDADKHFIRACSNAVARGKIRIDEVTRLLMINRLFTQSNRMLVLSMQNLTRQRHHSPFQDAPAH